MAHSSISPSDLEQTLPSAINKSSGLINYKVFVRCRPLSEREMADCQPNKRLKVVRRQDNSLYLYEPDASISVPMKFDFERIFLEQQRNLDVYKSLNDSLQSFMSGYNTSILAYGMTGAGKSHTMFGNQYCQDYKQQGIVSMVIKEVLGRIQPGQSLKMSFLELYNEQLRDLLVQRSQNLGILEDSSKCTSVPELSEHILTDYNQFTKLLKSGCSRRAVASTINNVNSSRSHSIIQITYNRTRQKEAIQSKLFFVDLAGSQRATQSKGIRLQEGSNINKSLLALGNCINNLGDGNKSYIPYRDSKLTRLLKDSLGGNSKTVLIVCISPSYTSYEQTLNALKYASRALRIRREVTPNVKMLPNDSELQFLRKQVSRLRQVLAQRDKQNIPMVASMGILEDIRQTNILRLKDYSPKLLNRKSKEKDRKMEKEIQTLKKTLVKKDLLIIQKDDIIRKLQKQLQQYKQSRASPWKKPSRQKRPHLQTVNVDTSTPYLRRIEFQTQASSSNMITPTVRNRHSRPKSSSRCLTPTTKTEMLGLQAVREISRQFKLTLRQLYKQYEQLKGQRMPQHMIERINNLSTEHARGNIPLSQQYCCMLNEFKNLIRLQK